MAERCTETSGFGTKAVRLFEEEDRLFEEEEDAQVRMSYLKEMCRTKHQIGKELQDGMNEHDVRMHQDIRFWWDENHEIQRYQMWNKLDDTLMGMATDPDSELTDRTTFMSTYNRHVQSYLDRTGPYEMPIYDEKYV
jgi:hypothetical protein